MLGRRNMLICLGDSCMAGLLLLRLRISGEKITQNARGNEASKKYLETGKNKAWMSGIYCAAACR